MLRALKNIQRMRRFGLVTKPAKEGVHSVIIDGKPTELGHSGFRTAWITEVIGTPKVIIELGAFDGGDVYRFQQEFPDCQVLAVEADPDRVEIVRNNLRGTNAQIVHAAVCETEGPIDWYSATVDGEANAQGSIFQHTERYKKNFDFVNQTTAPGQVSGRRLDKLCSEHGIEEIDLLHMDIEGAENAAMRGMGALRPKMIYLEVRKDLFENGASVADTEQLLHDLGYVLAIDMRVDRLYLHNSVAN